MMKPVSPGALALLAGAAACLLQYSPLASSQTMRANTLPESLKSIRQATGVCHKDDLPPGLAPLIQDVKPDMSCAVTGAALADLQRRPETVLLDLRQDSDFAAFHIPGALNPTLSDLHSKPYWRNKTTVLAGNGKAERELYSECARLKQLGYKDVKVLRGGVPSWLASGQPVSGRAPSPVQAATLSAAQFWLESQNPDNLVVLDKDQGALQNDVPFSMVLPGMTAKAIGVAVEKARTALKHAPLAAVVIVTGSRLPDDQAAALQHALLPMPTLFYAEGHAVFRRQVAVQKAVWQAQAHGPKLPSCG
jgi:rhodanese-related sulfurtransferase